MQCYSYKCIIRTCNNYYVCNAILMLTFPSKCAFSIAYYQCSVCIHSENYLTKVLTCIRILSIITVFCYSSYVFTVLS